MQVSVRESRCSTTFSHLSLFELKKQANKIAVFPWPWNDIRTYTVVLSRDGGEERFQAFLLQASYQGHEGFHFGSLFRRCGSDRPIGTNIGPDDPVAIRTLPHFYGIWPLESEVSSPFAQEADSVHLAEMVRYTTWRGCKRKRKMATSESASPKTCPSS